MDFVDEYYKDKDLSLLKKLTLVIPTYNRNYYLSRCLWYHAHFPFGEIIVADSSPEEKKVVNRETVAKVRGMFGANIRYLEYEPETEKYGGDVFRKWACAVMHVKTKYCRYSADKDFTIPTSIIKDIEYLDSNTDYLTSTGSYKAISSYDNFKSTISTSSVYTDLESRPEDDALQRIKMIYTPNYKTILYGTFCTPLINKICSDIIKYDMDIRYGEVIYTAIGVIQGKFLYNQEYVEYIRDDIIGRLTHSKNESSSSRYPTIPDYEKSIESKKFYDNFKLCVANAICDVSELTLEDAEEFVDLNIKPGIMNGYNKSIFVKVICKFGDNHIIHGMWSNLPKIIRKTCNLITTKIFNHEILTTQNDDIISIYNKSPEGVIAKLILKTIHLHYNDESVEIQNLK